MIRLFISLVLVAHLLLPIAVHAQARVRSPLDIPLAETGLVLGVSIAAAMVSWIRKVRSGEVPPWSLGYLIGEMVISAFTGFLTFWVCEHFGVSLGITACLAGINGLASARILVVAETAAQRLMERKLGLPPAERKP